MSGVCAFGAHPSGPGEMASFFVTQGSSIIDEWFPLGSLMAGRWLSPKGSRMALAGGTSLAKAVDRLCCLLSCSSWIISASLLPPRQPPPRAVPTPSSRFPVTHFQQLLRSTAGPGIIHRPSTRIVGRENHKVRRDGGKKGAGTTTRREVIASFTRPSSPCKPRQ